MGIRHRLTGTRFPKSVFTSIFGIYSPFSFSPSSDSASVNGQTWAIVRSHRAIHSGHLVTDPVCGHGLTLGVLQVWANKVLSPGKE